MENGIAKVREISWTQGQHHDTPSLPDIIAQESNQIFTVFIFVISAVLCLALLFIAALFIDCRKTKLPVHQHQTRGKILRLKLHIPRVGGTIREDEEEDAIVDRSETSTISSTLV